MDKLITLFIIITTCCSLTAQEASIVKKIEQTQALPNLSKATIFSIDQSLLSQRIINKSAFTLDIPIDQNKIITIELAESQVFAPDFVLTEMNNGKESIVNYNKQSYYHGKVRGSDKSMASIQIRSGIITGIIRYKGQVYNLGQYGNTDQHIIYEKNSLDEELSFSCQMIDGDDEQHSHQHSAKSNSCTSAVNIYIECDYQMYLNFNSNTTTVTNYITDVFNEVVTLYANENIPVQISQILVWTSNDPYTDNASAIYDFKDRMVANGYNGDLAHLVTNDPGLNGGIAYVDQLCGSYPFAYSDINNSFNPYPTYSWDVEVFAHEMGHNFGSRHTHSCVWGPNGNEQIDDCGNVANGSGGSCYDPNNPIIPSAGGTVMSYCHTQNVGIDFTEGFGTQPGDLIRQKHAGCFCDNSTCGTAMQIVTNGTYSAEPNSGNGASNSNATHADWFYFTAPGNGHIDIASCNQGRDTRLWLWSGQCSSLVNETYSDDDCTSSGNNTYASEIAGFPVVSGQTYLIEWDDRWSSAQFDWTFTYTSDGSSSPCQDYLTIAGAIIDSTYQANMILDSDGVLNQGNAVFNAGQAIEMNGGFEVKMGSTFMADIGPCTN